MLKWNITNKNKFLRRQCEMKEFWKMLEENESLLNLVTAIVCFVIIGIIALLCWIFGQVVRMNEEMKIRRYTPHTEEECRNVAKRIINLQQENQQLKEDKNQLEAKLGEANDIIDIEMELRDMWIEKYHKLRQVLDEIREYIESNKREASSHFNGKEYVFINYWLECDPNDLLQILDKVKK